MKIRSGMIHRSLGVLVLAAAALGTVSAAPQRNPLPPGTPEEQVIDNQISEMLAAWQIGDFAMLKNYYADDVTVVSGVWEPALMGWAKYLQAYTRQRERVSNVRLDRTNTFIHVQGNLAWATYQWDFGAMADGSPSAARGHTTLVFQKRDGRWLIVHNHTSLVGEVQTQPQAQPAPAKQPPKPGQ
jgi:ketosteroid isomerase-like protein